MFQRVLSRLARRIESSEKPLLLKVFHAERYTFHSGREGRAHNGNVNCSLTVIILEVNYGNPLKRFTFATTRQFVLISTTPPPHGRRLPFDALRCNRLAFLHSSLRSSLYVLKLMPGRRESLMKNFLPVIKLQIELYNVETRKVRDNNALLVESENMF